MKSSLPLVSLSLAIAIAFSGCESSGDNALAGAAAGAAIGGLLHGSGRDALHGAAIGAGAGYLIGKIVKHGRHERERREGVRYEDLPYAEPTPRYGFVTSPYEPYNLIDVRGIPHGAQVVDPSCGRAFINP
jgi:Glycine zipper